MLDLLIKNGQVVTPTGAGAWDIGVQGERIAAVAAPSTFTEAAKVIDAAGKLVVPGGVEPHTHLAHRIQMHPDDDLQTLGPEDDSRGMAFGGTTTHIDFAFVRPGSDMASVIEQRAARWKGNSYVDYSFHVVLAGALPIKTFEAIPEAIQQGFPSFKVFTTDILPPHPKRPSNRLDFGRIWWSPRAAAPRGGIMVFWSQNRSASFARSDASSSARASSCASCSSMAVRPGSGRLAPYPVARIASTMHASVRSIIVR